jgi:hypothetical protein
MKPARPAVSEERWLLLAGRYPALRAAVEHAGGGGNWKSTTWLGRCLGFVLGLMATSLLGGVLSPFPATLLIAGLVLVAVAEYLVARRHIHRSGVEEALYLCGTIAIVAQWLTWNEGRDELLAVVLVASAVLLTGWRLLNPLFTTIAATMYSLAIAASGASVFGSSLHEIRAASACAVLAVIALVASGREWQRPSHDRMLDGLVIVMPWLAFGWLLVNDTGHSTSMVYAALTLALAFFAVNLFTGLQRRQHAPLIGALGNLVCVAVALHELLHWPMHWQLIVCGGVLLVAAVVLDRALRERSEGITSRPIDDAAGLELMQLAAAAQLSPAPVAAPQAGVQGQGGDFGGGGASGRY